MSMKWGLRYLKCTLACNQKVQCYGILETVKCRAILTVDSWYLIKLLGKTYIVSSRNERGSFQEGKILITI